MALGLTFVWSAPSAEAGGFCLKDVGRSVTKRVRRTRDRVRKHASRTGKRIEKHTKRAGQAVASSTQSAAKHVRCAFGFATRRVQATTNKVVKAAGAKAAPCRPAPPC